MIAYLDGVVAEIRDASLVIQAGVFGLEVFCSKSTLIACKQGEALRLHTHLAVKEDDLTLYGFHDKDMLQLFGYLISVSGIGPKLALAMLSSLPTTILAAGIIQADAGLLSSAPGVGKKMAERIILELKTKLPQQLMAAGSSSRASAVLNEAGEDAVQALLALGYRESQVKAAIATMALAEPEASAEELIKQALAKIR